MVENDKPKNFEAILQIHKEKKPITFYCLEEKHSKSVFSDCLQPQDVIATVSKQIRDIQKADISKKECVKNIVKSRQSDFVPIAALCNEDGFQHHYATKFETQCVTDTQLIDIVDNVEAMIIENIDLSQDVETTFCNKESESKKKTNESNNISNLCGEDIIFTENIVNNAQDILQKDELCTVEVNTEVCKEFDIPYFGTHNDNTYTKNSKIVTSFYHCNANSHRSDILKTIENFADLIYNNDSVNNDTNHTNTNVIKKTIKSCTDEYNKFPNNIRKESDKTFCTNNINKELSSNLENDLLHTFYTDSIVEKENKIHEEKDFPSSPIFKSFKPLVKTKPLSPLIFPLDSFEKFESLAMPLMEENNDFEAMKHLINSQIIDNQLLITTNQVPILKKNINNSVLEVNNCSVLNNKLLEDILDKDHHVKTLMESKQVISKSTSFEDEVLFTSDEENDYVHYYSKDIPLACAMKTSFYESEIGLDETVFVGFQTRSNKCRQVNKDSYVKAKNVLDNIDKENSVNLALTEFVDMYDSKVYNFNNNLPFKKISDKVSQTKFLKTITTKNSGEEVVEETDLSGLKTANRKPIVISEKALLKCKTIFKDIEEEIDGITNDATTSNMIAKKQNLIGFKTASNKKIKISEESLAITRKNFEDIDLNLNNVPLDGDLEIEYTEQEKIQAIRNQNTPESTNLLARNKPVNIDYMNVVDQTLLQEFQTESIEEAIHKHNQVNCNEFQLQASVDFESREIKIKNSHPTLKNNRDSFNEKYHVSDSDVNENSDPGISEYHNILSLQDTSQFLGFKTANNKEIKVSEEAMTITKDLFHDIRIEDLSKPEAKDDNMFGCNFNKRYVSDNNNVNKFVNINKNGRGEWPPKSRNLPTSGDLPPNFKGFKTASNKVVKISKEALFKTEKIFQDINSISTCKDNISTKTKDDSNDNIICFTKHKETDTFPLQGLKTASNTSVNVSEKAIVKTEKIFQDMSNDINVKYAGRICDDNSVEIKNLDMYRTNVGNPTRLSNGSICHDIVNTMEEFETITNSNVIPGFGGFKTANNKPVSVSVKALLNTRKIFDDIDDIPSNTDILFKTAECMSLKGKLERYDKNNSVDNTVISKILDFQEGKTATDKQGAISKDALAKTKYIFKNIDCEINIPYNKDENEGTDCWKTTAENVSKNISEVTNEKRKNNEGDFVGFQTASNECVKISHEALAKSRKILDEINLDLQTTKHEFNRDIFLMNNVINNENIENKSKKVKIVGSKPITNKSTTLPDNLLKKSKQLFSDLDNNLNKTKKNIDGLKSKKVSAINVKNNINLDNTIDTQLLINFEETLHSEDFYKDVTLKQCKRSGSPILSCPKAKKRKKFETPYRSGTNTLNIQEVVNGTTKSDAQYTFLRNYKKTQLYTLKDLDKNENKYSTVKDPYIYNFEFDTLLNFQFEGSRNDFSDVRWTTDKIKTCFTDSVDNKIIPEGWLDNHLKLILWKLISYEIRFPNTMRGVCSVRNVLEQLKYRYDKELYRVERPALRKMLEKDDISSKTMILAVVAIYVDGVKVYSIISPSPKVELLLTDGWYCVKACTDRMISHLVIGGKIAVGRKIATVGAELLNCEQGVSPWEDTSAVRLKLFGNSTRPARWDAPLGFYNNGAILSKLSTIDPSGGKVCKTCVSVVRVYPALYVEKLEDGSTVTRSERLEHLHQSKYETVRQAQLEKLYEEVEKEFIDLESSESEGMDADLRKSHQSGSQLTRLMKKCNDPSQFRSYLTESQALLLEEYSSRKNEKIVEELQKRVQDKIRAQGFNIGRNVIPLLKIRVAGFEGTDRVNVSKAMVSIWRPNDAILDVVKEGAWIDLFNVVPTAVRNSEIQISAGRQSIFHRSKFKEKDNMKPYAESLQRKCLTAKDLNINPTMYTDFNEIDTVGLVFLVEPSLNDFEISRGQQFQNVYLTDVEKNFICINFWGGIKKFGYENIFDTGNVVACMNLQKRAGNTRKSVPQFRATELTVFTKTPKLDHVRNVTEELINKLSGLDKRKFCDDCILIKNNYATIKHSSEFSPYRFNTSDHSLTKNKIFIDSPLAQNKDLSLNLTGLDFESTFQEADTQKLSPTVLKRKQIVKEKIAKLKMYGEPPPLSKIHLANKSKNAGSAYKSPLTTNVARLKNIDNSPITTNKLIQSSPLLSTNRTFVVRSGVNPVKLNFSATSVGDDKIETNPYEEEFEASPPLSLD